jgi:hypothetical protein
LEPGHAKAVDGAVNFPQEEHDAQSKGNEETPQSEALISQKVEDKRNQQGSENGRHHRFRLTIHRRIAEP